MVELFSQIYPAFSWKDAEWLCGEWSGPKAIKVGILGTSCFGLWFCWKSYKSIYGRRGVVLSEYKGFLS